MELLFDVALLQLLFKDSQQRFRELTQIYDYAKVCPWQRNDVNMIFE